MGFNEYKKIWESKSNEIVEFNLEPSNKMDRCTVAVITNKTIIGYLSLGKTGHFSKTVSLLHEM